MNKLDDDLNIKNEKISQLQKDIDIKIKKNKELENEMQQKSSRFDGAINQFQDMRNQLIFKDTTIKNLQSQFKDYNDIKKKYENILKYNDKEKPKEEDLKTPQEEYYDAIVEINSIKSLRKKGWTLYYNKERKERYQQLVSEETLKIGVIGLNNVGKTFILSKLSNANLNPGYSLETKGISIKYSEINKGELKGLCILDSAGFETPLLKEEFEEIKNNKEENNEFMQNLEYGIEDDLSRDKAQIEKFIEQLIISLSDMIILVVGKMTRTEQRLITKIKNLIKKKEKDKIKALIIIHNLSQFYYESEIDSYIQNYLNRSATFTLEQKRSFVSGYEDRVYYIEKKDNNNNYDFEVFHLIMGKEGQESGNKYNDYTLQLIRQQYVLFNNRRKIDIPEEIIKLFSELSPEILGEKRDIKKSNENEDIIKLIEAEEMEKKEENKITQIQPIYMDQDGNYYNYFEEKYKPKYSLYYYREKENKKPDDEDDDDEEVKYQNYLLLRLELPGNITKLVARRTNQNEKLYGIIVNGVKEEEQFEERNKDSFCVIKDNRTYKEFQYFIPLDKNRYILSDTTAKGYTKTYLFDFDKRNKESAFKKDIEKNDGKEKSSKLEKIASGVYVLKFLLIAENYSQNN